MPIDPTFDRLLQDCTLKNDHKSCKVLDVYVVITRIHARLEEALKDLNIKFPVIGPDPLPEATVRDIFEGDPDTNPAKFLPVKTSATLEATDRLEVAGLIHQALEKLTKEFGEELSNMKTRAGKG
jgi:hypothetical protein